MKTQKPTIFHVFKTVVSFFFLVTLSLAWVGCGDDDDDDFDCTVTTISFDIEVGDCVDLEITNVTGGAEPYQYSIDGTNFQPDDFFSNVDPGSVTVTVRGGNGCTATESVTLTDNLALEASADAFDITGTATGGTAPYEYSVDGGTTFQSEATFTDLDAQDYTVTVRDAHGCSASASVTAAELATTTDARDGQTYQVVRIGDQIWFAENFNLNTNTMDSTSSWYYDDDQATYEEQYGRLYTWYVAQEIAPEGWELPSEDDYQGLIDQTGGGTTSIAALVVGGSSGFEFTLSGRRSSIDQEYLDIDDTGSVWTSNEQSGNSANGVAFAIVPTVNLIETFADDKVNGSAIRFVKIK